MRRGLHIWFVFVSMVLSLSITLGCREDKPFEPIVIDTQEELEEVFSSNNGSQYDGDLILTGRINSLEVLSGIEKIFGKLAIIDTQITSLEGLNDLILVTGDITITSTGSDLQNITDFCAIQDLLAGGSFKSVSIYNNEFNPTVQEIIEGDCSL